MRPRTYHSRLLIPPRRVLTAAAPLVVGASPANVFPLDFFAGEPVSTLSAGAPGVFLVRVTAQILSGVGGGGTLLSNAWTGQLTVNGTPVGQTTIAIPLFTGVPFNLPITWAFEFPTPLLAASDQVGVAWGLLAVGKLQPLLMFAGRTMVLEPPDNQGPTVG